MSASSRSITLQTPGKLNLTLDVLARRPDGFHEIESLMVAVGLYDTLHMSDAPPGTLEITTNSPLVPTDGSNLVAKAAELLQTHLGSPHGCRIHLEKRIPVGGGMGGGSSNGAAALQGLNELWGAGFSRTELANFAAQLGSDMPFFLTGGCAIVTGRGEIVRPARMLWTGFAALVGADAVVSTRETYARCTPRGPESPRAALDEVLGARTARVMRGLLRNDLAPAVFDVAPAVRHLRDALESAGGVPVQVTGAGAVLFVLFDGRGEAAAWCDTVRARGVAADSWVAAAPVAAALREET